MKKPYWEKKFDIEFPSCNSKPHKNCKHIFTSDLGKDIKSFLRSALSNYRQSLLDQVESIIEFRSAEDTWDDILIKIKSLADLSAE